MTTAHEAFTQAVLILHDELWPLTEGERKVRDRILALRDALPEQPDTARSDLVKRLDEVVHNYGDDPFQPAAMNLLSECLSALSAPAAAKQKPAVLEVWAVENKTTFCLLTTEEEAQKYLSSFPASVGGGMHIARLPVFGAAPASATADGKAKP